MKNIIKNELKNNKEKFSFLFPLKRAEIAKQMQITEKSHRSILKMHIISWFRCYISCYCIFPALRKKRHPYESSFVKNGWYTNTKAFNHLSVFTPMFTLCHCQHQQLFKITFSRLGNFS